MYISRLDSDREEPHEVNRSNSSCKGKARSVSSF